MSDICPSLGRFLKLKEDSVPKNPTERWFWCSTRGKERTDLEKFGTIWGFFFWEMGGWMKGVWRKNYSKIILKNMDNNWKVGSADPTFVFWTASQKGTNRENEMKKQKLKKNKRTDEQQISSYPGCRCGWHFRVQRSKGVFENPKLNFQFPSVLGALGASTDLPKSVERSSKNCSKNHRSSNKKSSWTFRQSPVVQEWNWFQL